MTLWHVRDGDRDVWVAYQLEDRFYVYDPHTKKFHVNHPLSDDYWWKQDLTYIAIDAARAGELIAAGVGNYDARLIPALVAEHRDDPAPLEPRDVLGRVGTPEPTARERAQANAAAVAGAEDGAWITWGIYPSAKRGAAHVAANQLRHGKVAAVRDLGPLEARVHTDPDGDLLVLVRRVPADTKVPAGLRAQRPA